MAQQPRENGSASSNNRAVLQEERYLWMARAFSLMVVLSVVCNFILLIALANVTPVMRVQPFYLETQNKEQQIISIQRPPLEDLKSVDLKQSFVRQYLLARFGMGSDFAELERRWGVSGPVRWLSTEAIYRVFQEEARQLQQLAREEGYVRNVKIASLNLTRSDPARGRDDWRASITLSDTNRTSVQAKESHFIAELTTTFRPSVSGLTWQDRLKNPLGFTVEAFVLKRDTEKSAQGKSKK